MSAVMPMEMDAMDNPMELMRQRAQQQQQEMRKAERVQQLGSRLSGIAQERIRQRQPTEERWLEDLQQYLGQYDGQTQAELNKDPARSKIFVNITRPKTNSAESRLSEMLFPSDDRNWAIQPTPVPELSAALEDDTPDESGELNEDGEPSTVSDAAHEIMEQARQRALKMQDKIDDQLQEAGYNGSARDVIHDACVYGTGIVKGPIVINRTRKSWTQIPASNVHVLNINQELSPGVERVEPWDFFPDMSARDVSESDSILERKYLTKKQLRELAKRPKYLADKIRDAIDAGPKVSIIGATTHVSKLRELSGQSVTISDNRFEVWEYTGPINREDLLACGVDAPDDSMIEHEGIVLFVGNIVIKADLHPLDTDEQLYSVMIYERDDTSIFGYGVPYLIRNQQRMLNGAIRTMLENAGLSSGPQIVVNREMVEPADGKWGMSARKVWYIKGHGVKVSDVFHAFEISSHQAELMAIFELAQSLADDVTALPLIAQGEKGDAPETATGMSMLMNSASTMIRRTVKQWDDNVTRGLIQRFYDWNMQYSEDPEIKGDFTIEPRGTSALLVKETQTAGLLKTMEYAANPVWTPLTKLASLYRKTIESQRLNPDDVVKDDAEIKKAAQDQAEQQKMIVEAQGRELQAKLAKLQAEVDALIAKATATNMGAMYSATQASGILVTNPNIAEPADELLMSGGFKDHNPPPAIPQVTQQALPAPPMPAPRPNTSPQFPARPQGAEVAMQRGMETPEIGQ